MTCRLVRSSFSGIFPRNRPSPAMCTENQIPSTDRPKSHPGGLGRWPGAPNGCQNWSRSSDQDCAHGDARAMGCPGRACTCRIACSGDPSLGPVAPPRCLGRPYGCPNEPRWPARASLAGNARAMVHSGACAMAGRGSGGGDRGIRSRGTDFLT